MLHETSRDLVEHHGSSAEWDNIWKQYQSDDQGMRKAYVAGSVRNVNQFWQRCYFQDFVRVLRPQADWRFLELASGRGTTSLYLSSYGMRDLTLVDLSETALETAKGNFAEEGQPCPKTLVADAESTGLEGDSYDCIYNIGVLEHFEDPRKILAESFRLLKPGGKIFMPIVPDMPYWHSIHCRAAFNPISLFKHVCKGLLGRLPKQTTEMVRTRTDGATYEAYCESVGFRFSQCIPYNPYWRVNANGSFVQRSLALPIYKLHYGLRKRIAKGATLATPNAFSLCLLLTASKPSGTSQE